MDNETGTLEPKVSVIMLTYGHEKYIKEAIDGIFLQRTDFLVEFIIANDKSPDSSDKIIREAIKECPSNIYVKYLLNEENMGVNANYLHAYSKTKGKYIASCEGDDFWTDPLKLQKQIDFLENNPEFSITFHKVGEISDRKELSTIINPDKEKTYTIEDLSKENFIINVSVVFKKSLPELPIWIKYSAIGDYPLHMINATFGKIKYFPQEMAIYRVGSGIWSTKSTVDQIVNTMFCLNFLLEDFKYDKTIHENLKRQYEAFKTTLLKPFKDKNELELKLKDFNYLERNITFGYLLKMLNSKLLKKLKIKK